MGKIEIKIGKKMNGEGKVIRKRDFFDKLRDFPKHRLLMLFLIFLSAMLMSVWAANVIVRDGDLISENKLK